MKNSRVIEVTDSFCPLSLLARQSSEEEEEEDVTEGCGGREKREGDVAMERWREEQREE